MTSEPQDELIEFTFPASSRFIRLSRLAVATLAAEMQFDVEETDDIRIAVDELVTLLVEGEHGAPVRLQVALTPDGMVVTGSCHGDGVTLVEPSDLVEAILAATTDGHDLSSLPGTRSFRFTKQRRPAGPGPVPGGSDLA